MHVNKQTLTDTTIKLTVSAETNELMIAKEALITRLGKNVKVQGFRPGKAPQNLVEKQLDPTRLQNEFLEEVINQLYLLALQKEEIRAVQTPKIALLKFVPYSVLEFSAEVDVLGEVKLPDYTKIKLTPKKSNVNDKDIDEVLQNLRSRAATKIDVDRKAKLHDQVIIDFKGSDTKTHKPIEGADGTDYPLVLGSGTFIPGFEEKLVGMKPGEQKTIKLTFPKDYGVSSLQNRQVTFEVTIKGVQQLEEPKVDDEFATTVGPFKNLEELKRDIRIQLQAEQERNVMTDFNNELLKKIADKTEVKIPKSLIDSELDRIEEEERRNVVYKGQTWQEYLSSLGLTNEEYRQKNLPLAEMNVKTGVILAEVADREKIYVSQEELDNQVELLKIRYTDSAMQEELNKPENLRDISNRMLSEKIMARLAEYTLNDQGNKSDQTTKKSKAKKSKNKLL